eukprot:5718230-Pleurochrysis_carterae.AAC.1
MAGHEEAAVHTARAKQWAWRPHRAIPEAAACKRPGMRRHVPRRVGRGRSPIVANVGGCGRRRSFLPVRK